MASIVFDLDGTLIDSAPDIRAAVNRMLAEEGCEPLDLPTIVSFIGNGLPKLVEMLCSPDPSMLYEASECISNMVQTTSCKIR